MQSVERIVLIGFSGTGKSTVGAALARRLNWDAIDIDLQLERAFGRTIPQVFAQDGEAAFRSAERRMLSDALAAARRVIACGGGAVLDPALWTSEWLLGPATLVVALDAAPETSWRRLVEQAEREGAAVERPLLAANDPLARIRTLKGSRQAIYDQAHLTLIVDRATPDQIAAEIASLPDVAEGDRESDLELRAPSGSSAISIRPGARAALADSIRRRWPKARRAWVVSDDRVAALHGAKVVASLRDRDMAVDLHAVPAGEESKSFACVGALYDWMLGHGVERSDVVVALGGGMVGDLAGFAAATTLRGVGLAQVPTSLLAMVDSSVGGKTGVNHRAGKNLIGAFYQPPVVIIDPAYLQTLPARELTSGWAEIVKHAVIQPSTPGGERADLARALERNADRLRGLGEPATTYLIRRNVALKAAVVEADEREKGIRAYLNFGHTLGHAIEAASHVTTAPLLHGEAIALGMRAAVRIGAAIGTCGDETVDRIDSLLDAFGLPRTAEIDAARALGLLGSDKKRAAGRVRWVLPLAEGGVALRDDVPAPAVEAALRAVMAEPGGPA
ncbi:MAG TPA: 3-dehydroquinate synthase [Thermomicrobiales bacterium]|nr:3-dehydroquinate synthase [Thermomicrobiales bacterium]